MALRENMELWRFAAETQLECMNWPGIALDLIHEIERLDAKIEDMKEDQLKSQATLVDERIAHLEAENNHLKGAIEQAIMDLKLVMALKPKEEAL